MLFSSSDFIFLNDDIYTNSISTSESSLAGIKITVKGTVCRSSYLHFKYAFLISHQNN